MTELSAHAVTSLEPGDLHDLCDAAEASIQAGGGFGWLTVPPRERMERYWQGVMTVPERHLIVGRIDQVIAGSMTLVRPPAQNEAQAFACQLTTAFVAPWAQNRGLARLILRTALDLARAQQFQVVNLDVRETQTNAIRLYESMGFRRWGTHPWYAAVGERIISGYFYTLHLTPADATPAAEIPTP